MRQIKQIKEKLQFKTTSAQTELLEMTVHTQEQLLKASRSQQGNHTQTPPSCTFAHLSLVCVWPGSRQWPDGAAEDEESCKSQVRIRPRYGNTRKRTHRWRACGFPNKTPFLCQTTCPTWSSTSTPWRSSPWTVTLTGRRRFARPSAAWPTSLKNSSRPWKIWWGTRARRLKGPKGVKTSALPIYFNLQWVDDMCFYFVCAVKEHAPQHQLLPGLYR